MVAALSASWLAYTRFLTFNASSACRMKPCAESYCPRASVPRLRRFTCAKSASACRTLSRTRFSNSVVSADVLSTGGGAGAATGGSTTGGSVGGGVAVRGSGGVSRVRAGLFSDAAGGGSSTGGMVGLSGGGTTTRGGGSGAFSAGRPVGGSGAALAAHPARSPPSTTAMQHDRSPIVTPRL